MSSLETLHLVTRCTRPQNLRAMAESILHRAPRPWRWWIMSHPGRVPTLTLDQVLARDQEPAAFGGEVALRLCPGGAPGAFCCSQLVQEQVAAGWLMHLDDDTILHERFADFWARARAEHPEALGYLWWLDRRNGHRYIAPRTREDTIDMNGMAFRREACVPWNQSSKHWHQEDQLYKQAVVRLHGDRIIVVPEVAGYYNYLA